MSVASVLRLQDATDGLVGLVEAGHVPDALIRLGIRRLLRQRLDDIHAHDPALFADDKADFVERLRRAPVALVPDLANEQHYEVPSEFFGLVLGRHRKYSACHWDERTAHLDDAEARALELSCEHAGIEDGMDVLDLGCGWGSLSLWIARHYPDCRVLAVSNSASQRRHIEAQAAAEDLHNVRVLTRDMNGFDTTDRFDRVVSVEMFEHLRNHPEMFRRIAGWLAPGGRFFMHVFCHRDVPYAFEDRGAGDWMSRHFFSGGMMPSADLPLHFQDDLRVVRQWAWNGEHYRRTSDAWLARLDRNRDAALAICRDVYGEADAARWLQRWRIFFMACAETFGFRDGGEWFVSHYLLSPRAHPTS